MTVSERRGPALRGPWDKEGDRAPHAAPRQTLRLRSESEPRDHLTNVHRESALRGDPGGSHISFCRWHRSEENKQSKLQPRSASCTPRPHGAASAPRGLFGRLPTLVSYRHLRPWASSGAHGQPGRWRTWGRWSWAQDRCRPWVPGTGPGQRWLEQILSGSMNRCAPATGRRSERRRGVSAWRSRRTGDAVGHLHWQ